MVLRCKFREVSKHVDDLIEKQAEEEHYYIGQEDTEEHQLIFRGYRIVIPKLGVYLREGQRLPYCAPEDCYYYDECEDKECDGCENREGEVEDVVILYDIKESNIYNYKSIEVANSYYGFYTTSLWLIQEYLNRPELTAEELNDYDCELIDEEKWN